MKRKLISLITVLALCLSLCPTWALAAGTSASLGSGDVSKVETLQENLTAAEVFSVDEAEIFDLGQWIYTAKSTNAIEIQAAGKLYLRGLEGSAVTSSKAIGIQVASGGSLIVEDPVTVTGKTYGLDIASGAAVELSGGTFSGNTAAIKTADRDFAALLADGHAYYDADGNPLLPTATAVDSAKTLTVRQCTGHPGKTYTHNDGAPAHSWVCPYCGAEADAEPCTFSFGADGTAACDGCGHTIAIVIDTTNLGDLIYNSQEQTANVALTVTLGDGTTLTENTDYEVSHTSRADVGEITVTVTGITYSGTFTKTYSVSQAQPAIAWSATTKTLDYNGSQVKPADLPAVTITAPDDLSAYIQYSYKKAGGADFTDGLPTNAGTYEVKASLPESQNYKAAETDPCLTLTINKIPALETAPAAKTLTYNREPQALVTAGVLKPGAVAEGAVIKFARAQSGLYSTDIPAETSAGNHIVWYQVQVDEAGNYTGTPATQINGVRIELKTVTPTVELSYYTTLYDGGKKEPVVTVKDRADIIPNSEYTVTYSNNQNVGTATVTVANINSGNYRITTATANFKITLLAQDALSITSQPDTVTYGDQFTLGTSGGSGNGAVTWKITAGGNVAEVNANSGQVTIKGVGTATVQATKSGTYGGVKNYEDAIATWTLNAVKKPVTATVTAEDKVYDGSPIATVHAVVEQGVLSGDEIAITGLSGAFSDENAGTGKTVTVTGTPSISGDNSGNYAVTLSSRSVKADITKAAASIETAPAPQTLTYDGTAQALVTAGAANIAGIPLEYALSENGPYSANIPTGASAGGYEVWYRVRETANYTGTAADKVPVTIQRKAVTPAVTLAPGSFEFDGSAKEPAVTVMYTNDDGEIVTIPAGEYTVAYSGNTNVGTATVTVTAKADGNYDFTATQTFAIRNAAAVLTGSPQAKDLTYTGASQELVTVGTALNGKVVFSQNNQQNGTYNSTIPKATAAGTYTIWYKVQGNSGYSDTVPQSLQAAIKPKEITPAITLAGGPYVYDGSAKIPTVTVKDGTTTILATEYAVSYTDNVNAGTATAVVSNKNGGNYIVNGTASFTIAKAGASVTEPVGKVGLPYDGTAQELAVPGSSDDGTVVYSLSQTGPYSTAVPTGTAVQTYTVYYKVLGDRNHNDRAPASITASIVTNAVASPTIELSSNSFIYNGSEQKPTVTVRDDSGKVIPDNEYTVTYGSAGESTVNVGSYTLTIASKGTNYSFTTETRPVTILPGNQTALAITGKPNIVYYGDTLQLGVTGGSGNGAVAWSIEAGGDKAETGGSAGQFKIKGVGSVTIKAVRTPAGGNYAAVEDTWEFYAYPKPVTPVVTAADKDYDGNTNATLSVSWDPGDLVNGDTVTVDVTGEFLTEGVGTNKQVKIVVNSDATGDVGKYEITYPATATASIYRVNAKLDTLPTASSGLVFDGNEHELLASGGTTVNSIGVVEYSLSEKGEYSTEIPKAINAGTYTVWYRVADSVNYMGIASASKEVTIGKATTIVTTPPTVSGTLVHGQPLSELALSDGVGSVDGSFAWTDGGIKPPVGTSEQEVTFTPADAANYEKSTASLTVTVVEAPTPGDGADTMTNINPSSTTIFTQTNPDGSTTTKTEDKSTGAVTETTKKPDGSSVTTVEQKDGSTTTVTTDASGRTETEVTLPAQAVSEAREKGEAVALPIPEVRASRSAETAPAVTVNTGSGDEVMVEIPAADVTPGTVAVIVKADGTQEVIKTSVPTGNGVAVSLPDGATVKLVDNSKDFADVPAESPEADAVAFISARELFKGTSETTFDPDAPMTRAMMTTVLARLDGEDTTGGATWYEKGQEWAVAKGISNGSNPNGSITREQLAVMLWRYAGCPAADGETLNFADADKASDYAMEALRWVTAKGILASTGDGLLDPGGTATRAEAAQILKNFIENA